MLWAVDAGNTQTVVGIHDGDKWMAVWRLSTDAESTEDELASTLYGLCHLAGLPFKADGMIVGSVVPAIDQSWERFAHKHLRVAPQFLKDGASVGLKVIYEPPTAVGADRIANAIAALQIAKPPLVVVDFGTATTLDCVNAKGEYAGGSILPGVMVSLQALVGRTAKLPSVSLEAPKHAVGQNTVEAIQSGVVLGYASAIEGLIQRVKQELGAQTTVYSTGGLGDSFIDLCPSIERHIPELTLDGLRLAYGQLKA